MASYPGIATGLAIFGTYTRSSALKLCVTVTSDSVQYESGYEPLRYMINYCYKPQQYSNVTAEASERMRMCKRISDQITLLVYKPFRHMFKSHQDPKNYFNAYFNILSTCTSIFES